jgi:rhodanese-related sulfurtransferase
VIVVVNPSQFEFGKLSFYFLTSSAELVQVLSKQSFAPVTDDSPRTFSSFRDGIGVLSSQSSPRLLSSPSFAGASCFNSSPDDTPSVTSNCGSAAVSPAVFNRLSIASPHLGAPSSGLVSLAPAAWVSSGLLATPFHTFGDSVDASLGHDLLSPFDSLKDHRQISNSAIPRSSSEESFDGNVSGRTQYSQAVTASNPGTPVVFDSSNRSNLCCALARSSSFGELCCLTEEKSASSPVLHFPARSMSVSTISSAIELHESKCTGGLSFLFFKRSRDGLNALSAQTLASMLRGGSNVDPPLLCPSSAESSVLRAGAACPLSQQLSEQAARFTVIDARYDFEFSGGHIEGAISINKESDLAEYFFPEQRRAEREGNPVPLPPPPSEHVYVFHCEYSQKRGPFLLNVNLSS